MIIWWEDHLFFLRTRTGKNTPSHSLFFFQKSFHAPFISQKHLSFNITSSTPSSSKHNLPSPSSHTIQYLPHATKTTSTTPILLLKNLLHFLFKHHHVGDIQASTTTSISPISFTSKRLSSLIIRNQTTHPSLLIFFKPPLSWAHLHFRPWISPFHACEFPFQRFIEKLDLKEDPAKEYPSFVYFLSLSLSQIYVWSRSRHWSMKYHYLKSVRNWSSNKSWWRNITILSKLVLLLRDEVVLKINLWCIW